MDRRCRERGEVRGSNFKLGNAMHGAASPQPLGLNFETTTAVGLYSELVVQIPRRTGTCTCGACVSYEDRESFARALVVRRTRC